jgi:hypothetical protein
MQKSRGLEKGPQSFCKVIMLACLIVIATFGTKKLKNKQTLQFIWIYENMVKF